MALSTDDVAALARLARIELSDEELGHLAPQLELILDAVASVSDVAADDIPPTSHALPLTNVVREDAVRPSLPVDAVLAGAGHRRVVLATAIAETSLTVPGVRVVVDAGLFQLFLGAFGEDGFGS